MAPLNGMCLLTGLAQVSARVAGAGAAFRRAFGAPAARLRDAKVHLRSEQREILRYRPWHAAQIALHLRAAVPPQECELLLRLDPFGDNRDAEALAEADDRAHDRPPLLVTPTWPTNERSILILSKGNACSVASDE